MSKLTLAGIRRGNQFSPNHIGNDAAIFALTAQHLRKLGCDVNEYIESDLLLQDPKEKGIFNMVRDWKSIHKLQELEDKNYFVVNSGYGIENCTREKMTRLLLSNHISHPESLSYGQMRIRQKPLRKPVSLIAGSNGEISTPSTGKTSPT